MTTVGDLIYKLNGDNTATVIGLSDKNKTDVIIPTKITVGSKEYTIKSIGNGAFYNNNNNNIKLKSVKFEANSELETIGQDAFLRSLIETIEIPKSVKSIGYGAFSESKLKTITFLGDKPEIEPSAFFCIYSTEYNPAIGTVDDKMYPKWKGVDVLNDLYINKNTILFYRLSFIIRHILSIITLLIALYMIFKTKLHIGIKLLIPIVELFILFIMLIIMSNNFDDTCAKH
jgi:hypothetical protein